MNFAVSWSEVWSREIFGDARMTLNCSASDRIVREFSDCPKLVARPKYFSAPGFAPANRKIQIVRQTNQSPYIDKASNLFIY